VNAHAFTLAMLNGHALFTFLDLAGTFAFALSGAAAARERGLDWFGVLVVAFTVACGGGVLRDLCIGFIKPVVFAFIIATACTGYLPAADSAESMTASVPS